MSGLSPSQEVEDSPYYKALTQYLSGKASLGDAQDAFCEPVEDKYMNTTNSSDVEGLLWTAWQSVVAVAASTPYDGPNRKQLVAFVVTLQERPTLVKGDQTCVIDGMTVWRDLPVLGWELREAWNFAVSDNSSHSQKSQWSDLNAWTASVVACEHADAGDNPDYSLFGLWTIRSGLEDEENPTDASVEATALWLIFAANALKDFSDQNKSFDGKVAFPGFLFSSESWTGFNSDRWNAWTQRLNTLHGSVSTAQAKKLVGEALDAISKAR